jgi:hypothetical protein
VTIDLSATTAIIIIIIIIVVVIIIIIIIFVPILKHIFNLSVSLHYFPTLWKQAAIVLFSKKAKVPLLATIGL